MNLLMMGASVGIRLALSMLTFAVMARALGPAEFGSAMTALAVSGVGALLGNFGLSTFALREMARRPDAVRDVAAEIVAARIVLFLAAFVALSLSLPFLPRALSVPLALFLAAQFAEGLLDVLYVSLRASSRFSTETRLSGILSIGQFAVIAAGSHLQPTAGGAATAYAVSRVISLFIVGYPYLKEVSTVCSSMRAGLRRIEECVAYAIDYALQGLFGQIDSIVLNIYLGNVAVGIYQAGMRLMTGGLQAATVLGNVYIPALSRTSDRALLDQDTVRKSQAAFQLCAALGGSAFILLPASVPMAIFGAGYAGLADLLPLFGLLLAIRLQASAWGMLLTVLGASRWRSYTIFLHWVIALVLAAYLVPQFGSAGWLAALVAANVALSASYLYRLVAHGGTNRVPRSLSLSGTALMAALLSILLLTRYAVRYT